MEASANDSKIITSFVPSLSYFSLVKVALPLFQRYENAVWRIIFEEMNPANPAEFIEVWADNCEVVRAKENLLQIPAHLRHEILETLMGLHSAFLKWLSCHEFLGILRNLDEILVWKTDGTIDRIKTAKRLLLSEIISIEKKFDLACCYFLEESVLDLWDEMEKSGKAVKPLTDYNPISRFWVKRMGHKDHVPWIETIPKHLDISGQPFLRFSAFFPFLQPADRERFLFPSMKTASDDFLLCLCAATKEEEFQTLRINTPRVLLLFLEWPLQRFFLEVADKLWDFIDNNLFKKVLDILFSCNLMEKDFDYGTLFMEFWERSPDHFQEEVKACPNWSQRFDFYSDFIRKEKKGENIQWPELEWSPELDLADVMCYVLNVNNPEI